MKLSIVVPVYNVEKYIDKCVMSILNQTYKDFELILVDDGSTDNCPQIIDNYKKEDPRIVAFHKENGGLMSAWKYGVMHSNGKYIGFVDSDDWIDSYMFQILVENMENKACDLVCTGLQRNYENGEISYERILVEKEFYSKEEIENEIFPNLIISEKYHNRLISPNKVTKLFKRDILLTILDKCYDNVSIGEDLVTTFNYLQLCNSILFVKNMNPYHYRINQNSMIKTFNINKYEKIKNLKKCLMENNDGCKFDFSKQIQADFIDLFLRNIEDHILFSKSKHLKREIKEQYFDKDIQNTLKYIDKKLLSKKDKLYLFLLKNKMYNLLIFLRKLKK